MTTNNKPKDSLVGFDYIAKKVPYTEERTVRRRLYKILEFLNMHQDQFKNEDGDLEFDKDLADFIAWFVDQAGEAYLQKSFSGKETTIDEVITFQDALLEQAEGLNEPLKSIAQKLAEALLMTKMEPLHQETMKRVNTAAELLLKLPIRLRVEKIEELHEPLDRYIEELQFLVNEHNQKTKSETLL